MPPLAHLALAVALAGPPAILDGPYPRAFFFRASEGVARAGKVSYQDWAGAFSRLGGIMGKVLDEEIPGTSARNLEFFSRFKRDHPEQAVLLHYNGNARDPRDGRGFAAEHWLYAPGALLAAPLPATPGEAVVAVTDPSLYLLRGGRYQDRADDLMIARFVNGRIDYRHAEQVELLGIDPAAKTLTVRRGCFGTQPLAFEAMQTVIQPHVSEGRWGRNSNLLWHYNWCIDAPRDALGRSAADLLVAEFARRLGPGGELANFDGVEFDVLGWSKSQGRRGVDTDGDNLPDNGWRDGRNVYALGVFDLCRRLRAARPEKLWMADGWSIQNQRAVGELNGIESEGWPTLSDGELADWSGGLNRHRYWTTFAPAPRFSYVNHKFEAGGEQRRTPLHLARLVQAACVLSDSAFTYAMQPPGPGGIAPPIYDELVAGQEQRTGWLGRPVEPPCSLAAAAPNLLDLGTLARSAEVRAAGGVVSLTQRASEPLRVTLARFDWPGGDATLQFRVRSGPPRHFPAGVPRYVQVALYYAGELLRPGFGTGMTVAEGDRPIDPITGAAARSMGAVTLAGRTVPAIFAHPPYRGTRGSTWWEQEAVIPEGGRLTFLTGLHPAPGRSDGVTYVVTATAQGKAPIELFRSHRTARAWEPAEAELGGLAGQRVRLRFRVEPGPAGDTTADQAYWGDVWLLAGGETPRSRGPLTPQRLMTYAGEEWFGSGFYFRDLAPGPLELVVEAEDDLPLELADIALHAAADTWSRRFEHGLVLANPSLQPQPFDLSQLGGGRYRRLRGTPGQDPVVNNGEPCEEKVTVPPRDALFLMADATGESGPHAGR